MSNHLIHEKSPYLQQHKNNPVDWYPWGEEAFVKARFEDKPVFLSIGYSTCHWCHVMERESFEDEAIAELLNRGFVCIKVDREERPDVDRIYMTAVQAMTGHGGWPLNAFLTPDLKPFFGGTYFPPSAKYGQPGFPQLLNRITELWKTRRDDLSADAEKLSGAIAAMTTVAGREAAPQTSWLDAAFSAYEHSFDSNLGGFGGAPKFPMPVNQSFLLRFYARTGEKAALSMTVATLTAMAKGGIHDQVGGGFHRYSVDERWFIPHFEKMAYDNAQLAVNFIEAWQASGEPLLADAARGILEYELRDMTHDEGAFFSAEDADSEGKEGTFYLWPYEELVSVAGEAFAKAYGAKPDGNIEDDPHGEFGNANHLYSAAALDSKTRDAALKKLLAVRAKRPRPLLDDKILTSWNGLMLSAFAKAARALEEPRYLEAAVKAARFLLKNLYDDKEKRLYRRWREGERSVAGHADDYAFLAQGLLDLYEASFDPEWLEWALRLTQEQEHLFAGPDGGLFMTAEGQDARLLARVMEDHDNVEPCASSVGALNLLRLSQFSGWQDLRKSAEKTLHLFGKQMKEQPRSMANMLVALDFATTKPKQIVIAAGTDVAGAEAMKREVAKRFLPTAITAVIREGEDRKALERLNPFFATLKPVDGKATAYVCEDFACKLPTNNLKEFRKLLPAG